MQVDLEQPTAQKTGIVKSELPSRGELGSTAKPAIVPHPSKIQSTSKVILRTKCGVQALTLTQRWILAILASRKSGCMRAQCT